MNIQNSEQIKENKKTEDTPLYNNVKNSFTITYILLLTTGTITLIEALRTTNPTVRHIMNLETCISLIAGYFYGIFIEKINYFEQNKIPFIWSDITLTRYIDWTITTPLMLIVLSLVLGQNTNIPIKLKMITSVIILNYLMLYIGYLGETGVYNKLTASIAGFVPFIMMFGIIFMTFLQPKYNYANYVLFTIFVFIWSLYGIVYLLNDEYKNIIMNILDSTAKCLVGISLWVYYTKIIQL